MSMRATHSVILAVFMMMVSGLLSAGRADNTLRGRLKPIGSAVAPAQSGEVDDTVRFDTIIAPAVGMVRLSGYDKPLRSSQETILITNGFDRTMLRIDVAISYLDLQGRQLHGRIVGLPVVIPPSATRAVRFKSWDAQRSYYYYLGQKPKVDAVTPYKVMCTVNSCVLE